MARSTPLLLALCLALAAAAASAAPIPPASRCGQVAAGMMGAWAETSTENVPAEAVAAIEIALIETANNELNSTWVPCDEPAVDIREACSQVSALPGSVSVPTTLGAAAPGGATRRATRRSERAPTLTALPP